MSANWNATQDRAFDRRSVLRLAAVAIPTVAAFALPGVSHGAQRSGMSENAQVPLQRIAYLDTFVTGTTKPSSINTGVNPAIALTRHNGDLVISKSGLYQNLDVFGYVFVRASGVTLRNCRIRGPLSGGFVTYGLVDCRSSAARNVLIESCTITPDNKRTMWWLNGVSVTSGATVTVRRCHIYHTVDGINGGDSLGTVISAEGNFIHDRAFFNNSRDHVADRYHPYWTHNDGIQISGGSGHRIIGNNIRAYHAPLATAGLNDGSHGVPSNSKYGACITVSPDKGPVTGTTITDNWLEGGMASFQMSYVTPANMNLGSIDNNRFGMDQFDYGNGSRYQIRFKNGAVVSGLTTNYFDPDADSVPAALKGARFAVGYSTGIRIDY